MMSISRTGFAASPGDGRAADMFDRDRVVAHCGPDAIAQRFEIARPLWIVIDDFNFHLAILKMTARLRSTSPSVVAHDDTLMRIAVCPCHSVPPHQQVPSL